MKKIRRKRKPTTTTYIGGTVSADVYIETLEATGWFDADPRPRAEIEPALREALAEDPPSAFHELAVSAFDIECIDSTAPDLCSYFGVLSQLVDESAGHFPATDILDELDREAGVATVLFALGGERYGARVPIDHDWFDLRVVELINESLDASEQTEHRYHLLPAVDQIAYLALVPREVFAAARARGLIPAEGGVAG